MVRTLIYRQIRFGSNRMERSHTIRKQYEMTYQIDKLEGEEEGLILFCIIVKRLLSVLSVFVPGAKYSQQIGL